MILHSQRCLVIPDVHQDIAWVERIFAKENNGAAKPDLIVFLGDYFDSRRPPEARATIAATCAYLEDLRGRLGNRVIFLLGNHDVQYWESRRACLARRTPRNLRYQCGVSFSPSAAKQIAKHLPSEFWSAARLFVQVNGRLLSHAGLSPKLLPLRATAAESSATLDQLEAAALQSIPAASPPHPLLEAGLVRGGDAPVGGITWLDWENEFEDALTLPQIIGHTVSHEGARQHGRSWCLDGAQSCYGVLTSEKLEISVA